MNCLKCGRETDQTFCACCRETMEKYPVKAGTIVLLPKERTPPKRTPPRRPPVSPEEQIAAQRKVIRNMAAVAVSLLVLLLAVGYILLGYIRLDRAKPLGQNYSTMTKATEETPMAETESLPDEEPS